jgi:hypothetical protein
MSEPKRYHHFIKFYSKSFTDVTGARYCYPDAGMIEDKDGKYVEYEDYARLKAEVERLTKAGDAMANNIPYYADVDISAETLREFTEKWHSAKEGKQS